MPEQLTDKHYHRMEWITCSVCGKRALVRAGGKGYCSRGCGAKIAKRGNHYAFKGESAGYSGFHRRVYRARGKADHCAKCGSSDPTRLHQWANLTGDYGNPDDYAPMCVPCHRDYDSMCRARGSAHHSARLTEEIVRKARADHAAGTPISEIAARHGVSHTTAARAVSGKTWAHVT